MLQHTYYLRSTHYSSAYEGRENDATHQLDPRLLLLPQNQDEKTDDSKVVTTRGAECT